jgi:hypothetical protein
MTAGAFLVGITATTMSLADQQYQANWDTKNEADNVLATHDYQVQVYVGTKLVAFADIDVVSSGGLKTTGGDFIALVDGRTLPVKVRLEQGWDCNNNSSCSSDVVPATVPPANPITVKTNDNKDWITIAGDAATGKWYNQDFASVVVTVEDVSQQLGGTPSGCAQGATSMVVDGHCMKITTDPPVTIKAGAKVYVCMTPTSSFQNDWKMLKYDLLPPSAIFLADPPAGACPAIPPSIGSTTRFSNPLMRLAASVGRAMQRLVVPKLAYAFDAGVGGTLCDDCGFSFFAPGRPLAIQKVAGDNQTAPTGGIVATRPSVTIVRTHHSNLPYSGAVVTCTVTGGGGIVAAAGAATETPLGSGIYVCPNWTLGPGVGGNTLTVTSNVIDPTAPGGSQTFTATGYAPPTISTVTLASTSLLIGDVAGTTYSATMLNGTGMNLPGVTLQGEIVQGTAFKGAGGFGVNCPPNAFGVLPTPSCTMSGLTANALNTAGGSGTLVPGPATFRLTLFQTVGSVNYTYDVETVAITLTGGTVTSVSVSPKGGVVDVGSTLTLTPTVVASGGAPTTVAWASSDPTKATVNSSGVVTGVSVGNVTIVARSTADPTKSASVPIKVDPAGSGTYIASLGITEIVVALSTNPSGEWTAKIVNGGPAITIDGSNIQGTWVQGSNTWPSGGTGFSCAASSTCLVTFSYATSNEVGGNGPLVAGPAILKLEFSLGASLLDTKTIPVTIVNPSP